MKYDFDFNSEATFYYKRERAYSIPDIFDMVEQLERLPSSYFILDTN
jgi:hypothetical protein